MNLPLPGIVKDHPFLTVGGIIGVIVVVLVVSSAGGGAATADTSTASGGSSDALSQLSAQLQASMANTSAQRDVALDTNASQITLASIGADTAKYAADKAAEVHSQDIAAQERVTIQTSTLAAAIQQQQLKSQENIETARISSQDKQTASILSNNVQLAQIAAQPKGLFSWLFG